MSSKALYHDIQWKIHTTQHVTPSNHYGQACNLLPSTER